MEKSKIFEEFMDEYLNQSFVAATILQHTDQGYSGEIIQDDFENYFSVPLKFGEIEFHYGASRFCFVFPKYQFVVKINFDSNEEKGKPNFCEIEKELYCAAKVLTLDAMFAGTEQKAVYNRIVTAWSNYDFYNSCFDFLGESAYYVNDALEAMKKYPKQTLQQQIEFTYYIYDFADTSLVNRKSIHRTTCLSKEAENYYLSAREASPLSGISFDIFKLFYECWGEEKTNKLTDFLLENNIDDIHIHNVGIINNKIVLIDYAGYY